MRIAIDLLWVRPGKNGGTESVIRNLLLGFGEYAKNDNFVLIVSKDNYQSFEKYKKFENFEYAVCNVHSSSRIKRVMWEQLNITAVVRKYKCDLFFSPIYSMPKKKNETPNIALIHDLQSLHFPEYFSSIRNLFMKISWNSTCRKSDCVVTISEFCKNDIIKNLPINEEKVCVIYNPIINTNGVADFAPLSEKYSIREKDYYYTVSSLAKHKNLLTLLKAFIELPGEKLVITGVNVNATNEIISFVKDNNLDDRIIFTGYITNEERDSLYKNCKAFLFPSIFEGFGMPPIEALKMGVPVITTRQNG